MDTANSNLTNRKSDQVSHCVAGFFSLVLAGLCVFGAISLTSFENRLELGKPLVGTYSNLANSVYVSLPEEIGHGNLVVTTKAKIGSEETIELRFDSVEHKNGWTSYWYTDRQGEWEWVLFKIPDNPREGRPSINFCNSSGRWISYYRY